MREVAWLRLGSCTDQVINAALAMPDSAIRPRPVGYRSLRASASRIGAGRWLTRGMTRSIAGMVMLGLAITIREFRPADATPRPLIHCLRPAPAGYSRRRDCCHRPASAPDSFRESRARRRPGRASQLLLHR